MITIANYCVGCAFCMFVCPEKAIKVVGNAEIDAKNVLNARDVCVIVLLKQ